MSETDDDDLPDHFEPDDLEEYNRNEADDYRNEHLSDETAGLHSCLISVADGSASPFLSAIDAVLKRAEKEGIIDRDLNITLYDRLYNALVVEYEDTPEEGADEQE